MKMGGKHVESPFIVISQIITFVYFSFFLFIMPIFSLLETTFINIFSVSIINNDNKEIYNNIKTNKKLDSTYNQTRI